MSENPFRDMMSVLPVLFAYCDRHIDWSKYPTEDHFRPAMRAIRRAIREYKRDINKRLKMKDPRAAIEMFNYEAEVKAFKEVVG